MPIFSSPAFEAHEALHAFYDPDSGLKAIYESKGEAPFKQPFTGKAETYTAVLRDYHTLAHGRPAPYTRAAVLADLVEIFKARKPKEVYVPGEADTHSDHRATFWFVRDAAKAAGYRGTLFTFVVHGKPPAGAAHYPWAAAFSPDGSRVAALVAEPPSFAVAHLRVWDLKTETTRQVTIVVPL